MKDDVSTTRDVRTTRALEDDVALGDHLLVEGLAAGLVGAAGLLGGLAGGLVARLVLGLGLARGERVRVELEHGALVLERVLLARDLVDAGLGGAHDGLDLIGVDEAGEVGVGHDVARHAEALLHGGGLGGGAKDGVELGEGALGPDAEAADVAARGELEQVEALDVAELHARQVAEGLLDGVLVVVDDERAAAHGVAAVAHLALAAADLLGLLAAVDVVVGAELGEDLRGVGGLGRGGHGVVEHERDLRHLGDGVAAGHDERRHGGRGERGHHGVALLVHVHVLVPLAPDLGRAEHAAGAAHVTEGTLAAAAGTAAADARDTRHGAARAPGLGRGLVARLAGHGVRLALVLRQAGAHELHHIRADRGGEHVRERERRHRGVVGLRAPDRHGRAGGSHLCLCFWAGEVRLAELKAN
mmetsp:Transcript_2253/g.6771  ORF Transcript_2253/g.6771 Transcript_2253/m.6771 type:complete len:416 (-) Transcript_2253:8-1255(-)